MMSPALLAGAEAGGSVTIRGVVGGVRVVNSSDSKRFVMSSLPKQGWRGGVLLH